MFKRYTLNNQRKVTTSFITTLLSPAKLNESGRKDGQKYVYVTLGQGGRDKCFKTFSKNVVFFLLGDSPESEVYVTNKSKKNQLNA